MEIIEISEPIIGNKSQEDEIAIGIDFGTSNSLIAISRNKMVEIFLTKDGKELYPSIIDLGNGIQLSSIKRLLGKSTKEIIENPTLFDLVKGKLNSNSEIPKLQIGTKLLSLPEIAAEIFINLKKNAEESLKKKVTKAVVTVPAYLDDAGKGQIMLAAKIAGFEILRLIAEPTAAAYSYGLDKGSENCYIIYDLGGGTFDVSILNMQKGIFQVLAIGGDNMLGGDDIDRAIAEYFHEKNKIAKSKELINLAKKAKETLSHQNYFSQNPFNLDRDTFDLIISPIIDRTINITKATLGHLDNINIEGIILIGGSSKIPLISKKLKETFNLKILNDIDPEKAVVRGAALQAENLTKYRDSIVIDLLPLSLGLELYGGIVEKIILRNSPIPTSVTKEFTTHIDNQTGLEFHILQGERELAEDCRSLAKFALKNLPKMRAGLVKVEVTFSVDADGILSISAFEKTSQKSHILEIKPSYGLDEAKINEILEKAYKNAALDHKNRLLKESILKANSLIFALKNAIKESSNVLTKDELNKIEKEILALSNILSSNDREVIDNQVEILEKKVEIFISRSLDKALLDSLKGKHVDEIN